MDSLGKEMNFNINEVHMNWKEGRYLALKLYECVDNSIKNGDFSENIGDIIDWIDLIKRTQHNISTNKAVLGNIRSYSKSFEDHFDNS